MQTLSRVKLFRVPTLWSKDLVQAPCWATKTLRSGSTCLTPCALCLHRAHGIQCPGHSLLRIPNTTPQTQALLLGLHLLALILLQLQWVTPSLPISPPLSPHFLSEAPGFRHPTVTHSQPPTPLLAAGPWLLFPSVCVNELSASPSVEAPGQQGPDLVLFLIGSQCLAQGLTQDTSSRTAIPGFVARNIYLVFLSFPAQSPLNLLAFPKW